jgi:hypothetical protein
MDNSAKTGIAVCSIVNLVFSSKEDGSVGVVMMPELQQICTNESEK